MLIRQTTDVDRLALIIPTMLTALVVSRFELNRLWVLIPVWAFAIYFYLFWPSKFVVR